MCSLSRRASHFIGRRVGCGGRTVLSLISDWGRSMTPALDPPLHHFVLNMHIAGLQTVLESVCMELMEVQIKGSGYKPSTDPDPTGRSLVSRALRYTINSAINEIVSGNCSLNTVTHTIYDNTYVLSTLHNLDQA